MSHRLAQVIKKDNVKISGSVRLDLGDQAIPVRTCQTSSQADQSSSQQPAQPREVRIVESNSEYAIIEVTCGCGTKCHIQCNYADVVNAQKQPAQAKGEN